MSENENTTPSNSDSTPESTPETTQPAPEEATFAEELTSDEKLLKLQEVVSSCQDIIVNLQQEKSDLVLALARSKADYDNFQKRAKRDRALAKKEVTRKFLEGLVPILDNLGFGLYALENADESVRSSFFMLQEAFVKVMNSHGVTQIVPKEGEPFNPELHQAISVIPGEVEGEFIANIARHGYAIGDQIFRPADVVVKKA